MPEETDRSLDELVEAVRRAQVLLDGALERAELLRAGRRQGQRYVELVSAEQRPLVVELLSDVLEELAGAGSAFRRAEARALHADGLSHEAIAGLFGVTRQRVGALLSEATGRRSSQG